MRHYLKTLFQECTSPRVLSVGFLAIPYGMTFFLIVLIPQAWLTDVGISNTNIGLFALVSLPYVLKFLWAPLVDIVKLPFLGRFGQRRSWLLFIHLSLMAGFILLSSIDPQQELFYMSCICFGLACLGGCLSY